MARPLKCRHVCCTPGADHFKPSGMPVRDLEEVVVTMDEFEALRLADLEGLYQEAAGQRMGVSRQTFGTIIDSAHRKIADCIVNGKAIKIEGGVYAMDEMREFRCSACQHTWQEAYGTGRPDVCPKCGSREMHRATEGVGHAGRRRRCDRVRCRGRSR